MILLLFELEIQNFYILLNDLIDSLYRIFIKMQN